MNIKVAIEAPNPINLLAMSVELPAMDSVHPNRMPFKGIMTRVGVPSDKAPHGSNGHLVMLSKSAAEAAIPSLIGMGVNLSSDLKGHDPQSKIGVITGANLDGDAIHIEGIIYAHDFPAQAAEIKAQKDLLGFSFEAQQIYVENLKANPWNILDCCFTGAAILRKDSAAYSTTSLAAAAHKDQFEMDEATKAAMAEIFATGLEKALAPIQTQITEIKAEQAKGPIHANAHTMALVEPHAAKLEACADGMMAAGVGGDPSNGHAVVLKKMAGDMRASAAQGRVPATFHGPMYSAADVSTLDVALVKAHPEVVKILAAAEVAKTEADTKINTLSNELKEVKAAARTASPEPERKTIDARLAGSVQVKGLLAKIGLSAPEGDNKIERATVDNALAKGTLSPAQRMEVKIGLERAGIMAS